jgi:hypothetical protein
MIKTNNQPDTVRVYQKRNIKYNSPKEYFQIYYQNVIKPQKHIEFTREEYLALGRYRKSYLNLVKLYLKQNDITTKIKEEKCVLEINMAILNSYGYEIGKGVEEKNV